MKKPGLRVHCENWRVHNPQPPMGKEIIRFRNPQPPNRIESLRFNDQEDLPVKCF